jgi:uracil-DNA glycosylase
MAPLRRWAARGVLLLNATLTVRQGSPRSHQGKGWEEFTDAIIRAVNDKRKHVVFMLWGAYAPKCALIDPKKHKVVEASHPSPRSVGRRLHDREIHSFRGCGHFKTANAYLIKYGHKAIEWQNV